MCQARAQLPVCQASAVATSNSSGVPPCACQCHPHITAVAMIAGPVSYVSLSNCVALIVGLKSGEHRTYTRWHPCDTSCDSSCSACDLGQQHSPILE